MPTFKFDHVHLQSPDPEATAAFYEKMFDAKVVRGVYPPGARHAGQKRVDVILGGQSLYIAPTPNMPAFNPPEDSGFGIKHIGLIVDDIEAAAKELERRGATFIMKPTTRQPGTRLAFVLGPQGVPIEIIQRDWKGGK